MKTTRLSIFPSLTIFLTFLTSLGVLSANAQVPSYVPTNGLVGYWPFNGNANDESGNGNNGTVNGGVSSTSDRNGDANAAFSFDGTSGYIDVTSLNNLPYTPITYSGWLFVGSYLPNTAGWQAKSIIGRNTSYVLECGEICMAKANDYGGGAYNNTLFYWRGGSTGAAITSSNVVPEQGVWMHFVYTQEIGGNYTWYINGVQTTNGNFTDVQNYFEFFRIGADNNTTGSSLFWDGSLDDLAIWNRAITSTEVLALYNGCNVTPQVVSGNTTPGAFANSIYTCNNNAGSTYTWAVNNGVIASGQGTNSVNILWGAEGVGSVSVAETTADGCVGDEVVYDVNVQCVVSGNEITGPVGPEAFSNSTYTCNGAANSTYNWAVTNGVIASGQGTNIVNILWASTGIGNVSVVETTAEGCVGTTLSQDVVVIPTNIEELSKTMILYPNPATTELNLQIASDLIGTDLFVFDALGKQMLKQQILSTNTTINTSSFAAGNYVVKVGGGVKKFEVVR